MAFTYQELRKKINQSKRELAEIEKYLKEGESLEKDIDKNAYQIEDRLKKIEEKLSKLKELEELRKNLKEIKEFADERKKPLEYPKQKLRNYLGAELDRRFREMGRHIEGNLPELKVELLTLEFLLSQSQVKIWYGPKIELLGRSKLIVDDITNSVIKIYKDLESTGFKDEQAFLKLLFECLSDSRIRIHCDGRNRGLPARLNEAVSLSQGKYFARMDGDDICYPTRLAVQVDFLERNPDIDLVGSRVLIFRENGRIVGTYPFYEKHSEICRRPWSGFYLPHPTWMGKVEWFRENRYCATATRMEDQELLLRTYLHSRFYCLPDFLLGYRQTHLPLERILSGRYHFVHLLLKRSIQERKFIYLIGCIGQIGKGLLDAFSISTGLNYKILRHRAQPVSRPDVETWERVWFALCQWNCK